MEQRWKSKRETEKSCTHGEQAGIKVLLLLGCYKKKKSYKHTEFSPVMDDACNT